MDVIDNGHGMPKAILPKIFDPFFTTKPVGKGTGLGLSICYGLIEKLGGENHREQRPGDGDHLPCPYPPPPERGMRSKTFFGTVGKRQERY